VKSEGGRGKGGKSGLGTSVPSAPDPDAERGRGKGEGGGSLATISHPPSPFPLPPSAISILFLGDANRPEFLDARACLERWGIVAEFADADSAAAALAEGRISPNVIVVAQAFPGQFSHQAIDRLRRLAPLARVLGLMGSWCEGEMRSGSPWPATVRTYWHQWPARCNRQFRRLATGQSCSWALPLTASEEERLLVDSDESCATAWNKQCRTQATEATLLVPSSGTLVAIRSPSHEMADWLSAACRSRGLVTMRQRDVAFARVEGAMVGVFDGTDLCRDECESLRRFVIALRPAPVIALLSFPRIEDHRRALSAGASVVLSKPVMIEDLLEAVETTQQ
jgi:CheY-like chemotaxis protein